MGGSVERDSLRPGCTIGEHRIEAVLGRGSFGITYLATDTALQRRVAIKEYFPAEIAMRSGERRVRAASSSDEAAFHWGRQRFLEEARTVAALEHPSLVRVHAICEVNDTAYIIMRYERGGSLQEELAQRGTLPEATLMVLVPPLLDGLEIVHRAGFVHRDVKPGNILIRHDGSPVLLDFGSARQAVRQATQNLTAIVSPGYAPFEQYSRDGLRQGPWCDIYSFAATLYRCVTGASPSDTLERSQQLLAGGSDRLTPAIEAARGQYSRALLEAIDRGLAFHIEERPQSVAQWRPCFPTANRIAAGAAPAQPHADPEVVPTLVPTAPRVRPRGDTAARMARAERTQRWPASRLAAVAALSLVGLVVLTPQPTEDRDGPGLFTAALKTRTPVEPVSGAVGQVPAHARTSAASGASVEYLLGEARRALAQDRLTTPREDNAFGYYRRVLALEPGNPEARSGLSRIARRYAALAREELHESDQAAASVYIDRGLQVRPGHPDLLALRGAVAEHAAASPTHARARAAVERNGQRDTGASEGLTISQVASDIGGALKKVFHTSGEPPLKGFRK